MWTLVVVVLGALAVAAIIITHVQDARAMDRAFEGEAQGRFNHDQRVSMLTRINQKRI